MRDFKIRDMIYAETPRFYQYLSRGFYINIYTSATAPDKSGAKNGAGFH